MGMEWRKSGNEVGMRMGMEIRCGGAEWSGVEGGGPYDGRILGSPDELG